MNAYQLDYYVDFFYTTLLGIVAAGASFYVIRALIQKRYGFGSWLNKQKYIFLITALFCSCYSLNLYAERLALYQEYVVNGVYTEGYVYHIAERERRGLKSALSHYYHSIRYRDWQQQHHATVYRSNDDMVIGDKVEVYYKNDNPADAYVVTYQESFFNVIVGMIQGVCWGLLSIVAFAIIRLNRKRKSISGQLN